MAVEVTNNISREKFYRDFVNRKRPVVIRGIISEWDASKKWDINYFKNIGDDTRVRIKKGNVSEGKTELVSLAAYAERLKHHGTGAGESDRIPYLHDIPIFSIFPRLADDINSFPVKYLPKWYRKEWWNFIQFFMGPKGSLTPLHFDTLYTHNLFFQVHGYKKFILIPDDKRSCCYVYNWRWARVNPQNPDYEKFPLFRKVTIEEVVLEPGDILYIPPGFLHQVEGLSQSISFNIDWHNNSSVLKGMCSPLYSAPVKNFQYNFVTFLGLWLKIPSEYIFPYYKSYLNYIS